MQFSERQTASGRIYHGASKTFVPVLLIAGKWNS
jgi:hypothetical protein